MLSKLVNGQEVEITEEEHLEAIATSEPTYVDYKAARADNYPDIVDQLDDIFHNGIDGWKATIQAVKDKYPKPE